MKAVRSAHAAAAAVTGLAIAAALLRAPIATALLLALTNLLLIWAAERLRSAIDREPRA